jgi:hypothetical protein
MSGNGTLPNPNRIPDPIPPTPEDLAELESIAKAAYESAQKREAIKTTLCPWDNLKAHERTFYLNMVKFSVGQNMMNASIFFTTNAQQMFQKGRGLL